MQEEHHNDTEHEHGLAPDEEARVVNALHDVIEANLGSRDLMKKVASQFEDLQTAATIRTIASQRQRQARELTRFVEFDEGDLSGTFVEANKAVDLAVEEKSSLFEPLRAAEVVMGELYQLAIAEAAGLSIEGVLKRHLRNARTQTDRLNALETPTVVE